MKYKMALLSLSLETINNFSSSESSNSCRIGQNKLICQASDNDKTITNKGKNVAKKQLQYSWKSYQSSADS